MRCGPHVMLPLLAGTTAHSIYVDWINRALPPVAKFCRQGFDPALMSWTRSKGTNAVGRWVEGDTNNPDGVLNELLQFAPYLDFVEFGNEERQGKDNPREWDRFMGDCLDFMQSLDRRNRAAGRFGPKACIANTSVGQPELERWTRPATLDAARYAAKNGHVWGHHEYYKPEPWAMIEGGEAAWNGRPPAAGWLLLRVSQVARIMRENGIVGYRFIITESGRDNIPGQPGPGGGFRDVPGEPYAERMAQYGRHLSAMPECIGWVDYGFNAWDGWKQFDLTEDPAMAERFISAQRGLPTGNNQNGGNVNAQDQAAVKLAGDRSQRMKLNPNAALQKSALADGFVPTGEEYEVAGVASYVAQRMEHPRTGEVRYYWATKGDWSHVAWLPK